jgi:2-dehydro-3-deoxygluconokinase
MSDYDVVTLGETMLRLTPPGLQRLEQATHFDVDVGGTESNMAIGLARLGLRVLWLSRLTANPLGRVIAHRIAQHGVDTSRVVWTDEDRVGLLFLEEGKMPRGSQVYYDRRHSAVSRMRPEELPAAVFRAEGARLLHLTGITVALSPSAQATAQQAMQRAKAAGWLMSFDVNYRQQLSDPATAVQGCDPFARAADIVFIPRHDACLLYNLSPHLAPEHIVDTLAARYPQAIVVVTLGSEGAIACAPDTPALRQAAFRAEEVERIGGGDAFAAGFLYAFLTTAAGPQRLAQALRWGAAMAALKYTIRGDAPVIERHEVERLLSQGDSGPGLRR